MANIRDIEGIGDVYAGKLEEMGINTVEKLLRKGAGRSDRQNISAETGLSEHQVLKWVNRADLARVNGIGSDYADLLEASGVDSVPELAQRNAENLQVKMEEVNASKSLVRRVPSLSEVQEWVEQAKGLDRVVTH